MKILRAVRGSPDPAQFGVAQIYGLTSPQSQDMHVVAREFSAALGREIIYANIPPDAWEQAIKKQNLPEYVTSHLVTMAVPPPRRPLRPPSRRWAARSEVRCTKERG